MGKGISQTVGAGKLTTDGLTVNVYRAERQLFSSSCVRLIKEGDLFTRRKMQGINLLPRCQKCSPFELKEEKSRAEELMESVLTPEINPRQEIHDLQRVLTEVEKRIGPALARTTTRHESGGDNMRTIA